MAKMNFQDALKTKGEEIERPKLPPEGTYLAVVSKAPSYDAVGEGGKWHTCVFAMKLLEPQADIEPDAMEEYGGDIANAPAQRLTFMFDTEDEASFNNTMYRLITFLKDHLQVDDADNKELGQSLAESVNHQCFVALNWRPDKNDPEIMYTEIRRTAPAN